MSFAVVLAAVLELADAAFGGSRWAHAPVAAPDSQ